MIFGSYIPYGMRRFGRNILYHGSRRDCCVCGRSCRRFLDFGSPRRAGVRCPFCGSLERHRLVWRYFQLQTDLFGGSMGRMLHVAPEPCLEPKLRAAIGEGYLTADLMDPRAEVKMDITDIQYPDQTFAVIYCSHVLEHVDDDRRAMREFHRVLKTGGWAILLAPITAEQTIEDPSITDPRERLRRFGQEDHVRRYGPDYGDRLREAGFEVKETQAADFLDEREIERMALGSGAGQIFYCTR